MYTRRPFSKENAHNLRVEMHKWSEPAGMCVWGQYMKVGHVRWYERVCMQPPHEQVHTGPLGLALCVYMYICMCVCNGNGPKACTNPVLLFDVPVAVECSTWYVHAISMP